MDDIRDELIDTSELEIKELEGYYDVFNSAENKIKDGENEANSNIEEIKKQNEERLQKAEEEAKKIEDAKSEIENLKENYKISLKQIYDSYQDKLEAINKAIEACSTNSALKGALEEERGNMTKELDEKSNSIKSKIAELTSFLGSEEVNEETKEDNDEDEASNEEIERIIKSIQEKIDNLETESNTKEESNNDDLEAIIKRIDEKISSLQEEPEEDDLESIIRRIDEKINALQEDIKNEEKTPAEPVSSTTESDSNEIVEKTPVDEEQIKDILLSEEVNDSINGYLG